MSEIQTYRCQTQLVQIGNRKEPRTGAVNPPIYLSTAYRHEGVGQSSGYDYVRTGNPTRQIVEEAIAELEKGDEGYACSSGMAAIHTLFSIFEKGDEIIASLDLYGGTYRLFEQGWSQWGLSFRYVDPRDLLELEGLITDKTKALFIETPTNPLMQVVDIEEVSRVAKRYNLLLIVDNTFYTPLLQRPIEQGADIVIHSATKYLGGHNDVLAGLIVAKGTELCTRLKMFHNAIGAVLSPFDSWLLIRGMKTLSLRMQAHTSNAKTLVKYLREHDGIAEVLYPGAGGMISFRLKESEWVNPFLQQLKLITFAESLGGVESFITYPFTQTHADIPEEKRIQNGICQRLLRFSVGVEHVEDLIVDLEQALAAAQSKTLTKTEVSSHE